MAFNIGKKKDAPADDWSDAALTGDAAGSTPVANDPADAFGDTIDTDTAPPRKNLAPVFLAAGAVLLLTAVGLGVYFLFLNKPAADADVDNPVVVQRPGKPGAPVGNAVTPGRPPVTTPDRPVKKTVTKPTVVVAKPAAPADPNLIAVNPAPNVNIKVKAGRAGIAPPGTSTPAVQSQFGDPPSMAPKPNQPKPIDVMRDGEAGKEGKGLPASGSVPVVRPLGPISPALMTQLKTLWQQGAAAKRRGDKAAARRAWQKILQLRPGHPGIQEAIDKL